MFGNKALKEKIRLLENGEKVLLARNEHLEGEIEVLRNQLNERGELHSVNAKETPNPRKQRRAEPSSVHREESDASMVVAAAVLSVNDEYERTSRQDESVPELITPGESDPARTSSLSSGFDSSPSSDSSSSSDGGGGGGGGD